MPRATRSLQRLLIIGSTGPMALETFYVRAFSALGVEATVFDPEAPLVGLRRSRVLSRATWSLQHLPVSLGLRRFIEDARGYDAVLVFKGLFLSPSAIRAARARSGVPWLNLNPDSPFDAGRATSNGRVRRALPLFDAYLIWSRKLVVRLQSAGCQRVAYVPFAYDESSHFPATTVDSRLEKVITFVGSHDSQRADMLEALSDLPIRIYGNAWNNLRWSSALRSKVERRAVHGEELRRVVTSSLASINILRPQNAGAHNMRTFEVPAMGGLLLTSRSAEQHEFFPEGQASLMFATKEELRRRAEELLAGKYDAGAIKRRALALSADHSYKQRAKLIADLVASL